MSEKKDDLWTIEGLIALTDKVQSEEVEFRGKILPIQFCELTEEEEPTGQFREDFENDEEKMAFYQEIGTARVLKMITKANEKLPDGTLVNEESWKKLPTTLRYAIANKIMGINVELRENFTMG